MQSSSRLLLTLDWGWSQPIVYYVSATQIEKLIWEFPSESCNYADGWMIQLYYANERLLLITENALYVALYNPSTNPTMPLKTNDWHFIHAIIPEP